MSFEGEFKGITADLDLIILNKYVTMWSNADEHDVLIRESNEFNPSDIVCNIYKNIFGSNIDTKDMWSAARVSSNEK